ncbi:MAG: hypothetical protein J1E98_02945 [Lachnospiraceae bacterium]|nr:hypothetical protein [Lachnospiraceae bacterium]
MFFVSESIRICGKCGTPKKIEWDLDVVDSYEKDLGINNIYASEKEIVCEKCGSRILATFRVSEYPEGILEDKEVYINYDEAGGSQIVSPEVEFYDL